jgi:hypothetical protein
MLTRCLCVVTFSSPVLFSSAFHAVAVGGAPFMPVV